MEAPLYKNRAFMYTTYAKTAALKAIRAAKKAGIENIFAKVDKADEKLTGRFVEIP